jgi:hypothetical protein
MDNLTKLQLAWKYRKQLWKYRSAIRHRRQILAFAALGAAVAAAWFTWPPRTAASRENS